jgi:molybdenum cofactor cytidylyltransferase
MASTTAAVVLAGGASRRLGHPKQLVLYRGRPLLEHVVQAVLGWPVDRVVVVLGASAEDILEKVEFGSAVVAINDDWEEGIAASLRVGLDVLARDPHTDLAFVVLGDQPGIPPDVPQTLLDAAETSLRLAIVPVYRYERSNPVLFRRQLWERLMTLEGDQGAAELLRAHADWVEEVRVDHLPPRDIDTADDVADLDAAGGRHGGTPAASQ